MTLLWLGFSYLGKDNKALTVVQVVGGVGLDDKGLGGGKLGVVHLTWV